MQDIATLPQLAQNLQSIAAAFKDGGILFLIGTISFLGYKAILAISARQRKASQEVTVNIPGTGHPRSQDAQGCPFHTGHEQRLSSVETAKDHIETDLEKMRTENREDHEKIFTKLTGLEISTSRIEIEVKSAASAANSAAAAAAASAAAARSTASMASRRRFQPDPSK